MGNKTIILFTIIFIFGCDNRQHITENINRTKTIIIQQEILIKKVQRNKDYAIVVIDRCEYIRYFHFIGVSGQGVSGGGLTHKGNCYNPIHKNKL